MQENNHHKKLRARILLMQWSGFVVRKLKFVFVCTPRDKFNLGMTTNFNTILQTTKMNRKSKVNRPKNAKEISFSLTCLFQRKFPTTSVNISFYLFKNISQTTIYQKTFNKNDVKICQTTYANIKLVISIHNKEVITERKTHEIKCSCINKPDCPNFNQCQITNIIYRAKIRSNLRNYHGKI